MKQNDIRTSTVLKILSFCIIPITICIIIANIVCMYVRIEEPEIASASEYTNTKWFANKYMDNVIRNIRKQKNNEKYKNAENISVSSSETYEETYGETYYSYDDVYYEITNSNGETIYRDFWDNTNGFKYLFINETTKEAYTNISLMSDEYTIENLRSQFSLYKIYLNYNEINRKLDTSIASIDAQDFELQYQKNEWDRNLEIITSLDTQFLSSGETFYLEKLGFDILRYTQDIPFIIITPTMCILSIIALAYLSTSIGHKKGYEGIYLNWFDKIPLELVILVLISINLLVLSIIMSLYATGIVLAILIAIYFIILYFCITVAIATIVKRAKAHTFIKNTLIYKIISGMIRLIKNVFENFGLSAKIAIVYLGFLLTPVILSSIMGGFGFFLSLVFWAYVFIILLNRTKAFKKIKLALKDLYNGITNNKIDDTLFKGDLKDMAMYINDISGGFSNAVEESLKSERMKTELITNVSHDIKTPLTSIINYVDLLKKENIENEKAKEYIEILDNKSQRLKKLTDDLVEAAKASSGNVKLNMEKINIIELLKQTSAEFEDKFAAKELELIYTMPEEVNIMADSRYMFRIVENIFSNVSKYALENSRVYIDVITNNNKVYIGVKNISKQRLNISADELMQRFVRGDKSRNTEGSGLGLSISKSLTELQNGVFNMQIDGDLFKVELEFTTI